MITANKINYAIGDTPILDELSVALQPGAVTAILGPNGAGKSTLMKCLCGTLQPQSGNINIAGRDLQTYSLPELSRRRAVLAQSTAINFPFTVLELVMMGRNPHVNRRASVADNQIAQQALDSVDAWSLKNRIFPTLSGGEQQRVQLARVLAQIWGQKQAYLFLDEPTAALDLKHQHQIFKLIRTFSRSQDMTVCVIIHDPHLAQRYCDQAILMYNGKVFAAGLIDDALSPDNIQCVFEIPPDWLTRS